MAKQAITILHVFPSFAVGGQQRRLATLAQTLGDEFTHRILSLDGDMSAAVLFDPPRPRIEPVVIEKSRFIVRRNLDRLTAAISQSGADLLCTYNFGSIEAAIANRFGPRLPHIHHEDGFASDEARGRLNWKRSIARRLALSNARVVVPSKTLERIAVKTWRLGKDNVTRIPVGIDVGKFNMPRGARSGPVIVGAIGALRREKNFARLIRCFGAAKKGLEARLVIFGDGPERPRLLDLAAASADISLPGSTSAVAEALSTFDIFAIASDTEQMPTSLVEAMASGLPAIATNVGDIPEMLGDESREFVIDCDDEEAFAARLRTLICDEGLRRRLGAANCARAAAFDVASMTAAFRQLFMDTAGRVR